MKSYAVDLTSEVVAEESVARAAPWREKMAAYLELTKPRITLMIVLTAAAGFCLGTRENFNYTVFAHALVGLAMLSSGIATLNQYLERDLDRLMRRTALRPLPTGKLTPAAACTFGLALTLIAEIYLTLFVNPLTALMGVAVIIGYVLLYTPLKTRTTLSTFIGAFPGAMPPLMGWTAARNGLGAGAWVLFGILFLWQFPHFLAIAWMYREDYARAGILMLPVVEPEGHGTARRIVITTLMLLPVSLLPTLMGMAGWVYFYGALILGLLFLYSSVTTALNRTQLNARRLLLTSVLYLPLLFALMVVNR